MTHILTTKLIYQKKIIIDLNSEKIDFVQELKNGMSSFYGFRPKSEKSQKMSRNVYSVESFMLVNTT